MKRFDEYPENAWRAQSELLRALHRQQAVNREQAEFVRLKPLLRADIDAAWKGSTAPVRE